MPLACFTCGEPMSWEGPKHTTKQKPPARICEDCAVNGFEERITGLPETTCGDSAAQLMKEILEMTKTKNQRKGQRYYVGNWEELTRAEFEQRVLDGNIGETEQVGLGSLKAVEFHIENPQPRAVISVPSLKRDKAE